MKQSIDNHSNHESSFSLTVFVTDRQRAILLQYTRAYLVTINQVLLYCVCYRETARNTATIHSCLFSNHKSSSALLCLLPIDSAQYCYNTLVLI
jgi:hypothetical protein